MFYCSTDPLTMVTAVQHADEGAEQAAAAFVKQKKQMKAQEPGMFATWQGRDLDAQMVRFDAV